MEGADRGQDELLALLSVRIGMIMEDHVDEAVTVLPERQSECVERFRKLRQAGRDVVALADAAEVLLRPR